MIDNGSQNKFIDKDIDLKIGKTNRYFTKLDTAQLQVIDEVNLEFNITGHNTSVTIQLIQDLSYKYRVILSLEWLNNHRTVFIGSEVTGLVDRSFRRFISSARNKPSWTSPSLLYVY